MKHFNLYFDDWFSIIPYHLIHPTDYGWSWRGLISTVTGTDTVYGNMNIHIDVHVCKLTQEPELNHARDLFMEIPKSEITHTCVYIL